MIPYNTEMEPVLLQEYGRNIQNLVDYCVSIPDRNERTECAYSIVDILVTLHPEVVGENHDMSKAWDILNILSRFELDIDFPCEVVTAEKMNPKPEKIPYTSSSMRFRSYGKNIEQMISRVADMEDSDTFFACHSW